MPPVQGQGEQPQDGRPEPEFHDEQSHVQGGESPLPQAGSPHAQHGHPFAAPPVPAQELTEPRWPRTVEMAFWIAMVVPLVVGTLDTVFAYLTNDVIASGLDAALARYGVEPVPAQDTDWLYTAVMYLVLVALWIAFGLQVRAGRNWARVTLIVLAAVWLGLELLSSLLTPVIYAALGLPWDLGLPIGLIVMTAFVRVLALTGTITFIVLVCRKPSKQYFQETRSFQMAQWRAQEIPWR
ncbi:hypothetical protein ATL45_0424 [Saccharopolyspora antimicrobica]|uniref:Uncharacterized protein n=1 Tax=Saccharopolyspora antimicrobica TaxID=455193 RepID=A0ABX9T593_9PSEU|nr:hypothetical protein ATL45_0424 [Saccharopolyspora antimicrobica]